MEKNYFLTRHSCPSCQSYDFEEFYSRSYLSPEIKKYLIDFYEPQGMIDFKYLINFDYVLCECNLCKTIFQKYIPNNEFVTNLYEVWISPNVIKEQIKNYPVQFYQNLANEIIQVITLFNKPPAFLRFLDFGMGWACWSLLAQAYGVNTFGVELSSEQIKHANNTGIKTILLEDIPDYKFDFINTEQVFEHINSPLETLKKLKSGLSEDGIIKISVPFVPDIERRISLMNWTAPKGSLDSLNPVAPLEHINYFRPESLLKMAELAELYPVFKKDNENYFLLKHKIVI